MPVDSPDAETCTARVKRGMADIRTPGGVSRMSDLAERG